MPCYWLLSTCFVVELGSQQAEQRRDGEEDFLPKLQPNQSKQKQGHESRRAPFCWRWFNLSVCPEDRWSVCCNSAEQHQILTAARWVSGISVLRCVSENSRGQDSHSYTDAGQKTERWRAMREKVSLTKLVKIMLSGPYFTSKSNERNKKLYFAYIFFKWLKIKSFFKDH